MPIFDGGYDIGSQRDGVVAEADGIMLGGHPHLDECDLFSNFCAAEAAGLPL